MSLKKFDEYMNAKGNVEKPKISTSGDNVTGMDSPNYKKPKLHESPYVVKGAKNANKKEKGFADEGDQNLVFNYEKEVKPADIPTVKEFAHLELVPLVTECVKSNPMLIENIVRDLKRNGVLGILVGELVEHSETYNILAELMESETYGPSICKKLAKAIREQVSSAEHKKDMDDEDSDDGDDDVEDKEEEIEDAEEGGDDDDDEDDDDEQPADQMPRHDCAKVHPDMDHEEWEEGLGESSNALANLQNALWQQFGR